MKALILTRKEKEELVIKLAEECKSTRQIAEIVHISLKDIGAIKRRYIGEEEPLERNNSLSGYGLIWCGEYTT